MGTVYSTVFLNGNTSGGAPVYTVPAGFVAVLRDADVYNNSLVAAELFLEDSASGVTIWRVDNNAFIPGSSLGSSQWQGRQVFTAGNGFLFNASSGTWDVRASGYLLQLP